MAGMSLGEWIALITVAIPLYMGVWLLIAFKGEARSNHKELVGKMDANHQELIGNHKELIAKIDVNHQELIGNHKELIAKMDVNHQELIGRIDTATETVQRYVAERTFPPEERRRVGGRS